MTIEQVIEHRVAWVDTDASGRIHWTAPLRWAELAEGRLVSRLGYIDEWRRLPRRHVEVEYLRALVFDDALTIRIAVSHVGRTSVGFEWTVTSGGEVCTRGSHTTVYIDDDGRPEPLPPSIASVLR